MPQRPTQMELLDWTPPVAVERFEEQRVRAVTLPARLCRAMAAALHDAAQRGVKRAEVARQMSEYLGESVSIAMLDAYVSEARDTHVINLPRFVALVHATQDRRLLDLIAGMFGWAVVPEHLVPLIEATAIQHQMDTMKQRKNEIIRRALKDGAL